MRPPQEHQTNNRIRLAGNLPQAREQERLPKNLANSFISWIEMAELKLQKKKKN